VLVKTTQSGSNEHAKGANKPDLTVGYGSEVCREVKENAEV
jgi:hypothetical protein